MKTSQPEARGSATQNSKLLIQNLCTVALLGNPNTGKTTLFNALAGMRQRVGNYPGVTVETKKGQMTVQGRPFEIIDLPGTYSLAPRSPDEMVAVDLILGQQKGESRPDVVVAIVDASNLERNLYLTTQALELGVPVVVALNMIDVAAGQGIYIDAARLGRQLGVPVVPIQANKRRGLDKLKDAIARAATDGAPIKGVPFPEPCERETVSLRATLGNSVSAYLVRRLLFDVGGYAEARLSTQHPALSTLLPTARQRLSDAGCPVPATEAKARYAWIREVTAGCIERPKKRPVTWTDRLDRILTHKIWGTLVFLVVMFVVFQSIFEWARPLMNLIGTAKDQLREAVKGSLPTGPLTSLLADGMIEGVGSVLQFLPQIVILFGFIAILEDCGYMARAAFLMDKIMARCGLSGKSFIPMLSSVACAVPGIMATRVIENRRDRLATILVAPLMSCSARLPVYILLTAAFIPTDTWLGPWLQGLTLFSMYLIGLVVAPAVALVLKRTLLRGETPVFVMEMPMYKMPSVRTVLRRMQDSSWAFLRRAGTLILASMIVVWALLYFPNTDAAGVSHEDFIVQQETRTKAVEQDVDRIKEQITDLEKELDLLEEQGANDQEKTALRRNMEEQKQTIEEHQLEIESLKKQKGKRLGEWKRDSILGRSGRAIEPVVTPLGWDWRIGTAALASFPAREVVVGTLGIIYQLGEVDTEEIRKAENAGETELATALREAHWDNDPERKVYTVPTALSLMVFFALCCQCASTLAVIKRETRSWRWPVFTFVYMTVLAYIGALVVYQVGTLILG